MEELSWLIGEIYDTLIYPDRWSAVLESIAKFVRAKYAILLLEDAVIPEQSRYYISGDGAKFMPQYFQSFMLINPARLATVGYVQVGDVVLTSDFMTKRQYHQTRFFREWLVELKIVDCAAAIIEKSATQITILSALRGDEHGAADRTVRRKLQLLLPHVQRATSIQRLLMNATLEAATLADTLDRLKGSVFLLDARGTVLHANAAARLSLGSGVLFRMHGSRLTPVHPDARADLNAALAAAAKGDTSLGNKGNAILLGVQDGVTVLGSVISLVSGARRRAGETYQAVAALFVREASFQTPDAIGLLMKHYALTPQETTVLVSLVEIGGVPDVARVLGLSQATVRGHLKAVYRKTETGRQSDLVKLIVGASTPFA